MGEATPELQEKCDELAMEAFLRHLTLANELEKLDDHNATYPMNAGQALASIISIQLRRGQVNQAEATATTLMRTADKLLETAPDNADYLRLKAAAWRGLGSAHSRSARATGRADEEFEQSRSLLEKLLAQTPDSSNLRWSYANTLEETAGHARRMGDAQAAEHWRALAEEQVQQLVRSVPGNKVYTARLKALQQQAAAPAAQDAAENP